MQTVRDDIYLIGKKLHNMKNQPENNASSTSSSNSSTTHETTTSTIIENDVAL